MCADTEETTCSCLLKNLWCTANFFGCLWLLLTQTSVTQKQALFFWACKTGDLGFLLYKSWRIWFSHMSSPAAAVLCFYTKKPQRSTFSMCTDPTGNQTHSPCSILPCSTSSERLHKQFIPQIKCMVGKRYFPDFQKSSIQCSCLKNSTRFLLKSDWHLSQRDLHRISHIVRLRIRVILRKTTQN